MIGLVLLVFGIGRGDQVPDSGYVREFCKLCGTAMRVSERVFQQFLMNGTQGTCDDCLPEFRLSPRPCGGGRWLTAPRDDEGE